LSTLIVLPKHNMKLVNGANNHFLILNWKRTYCQQWAVCMWDDYSNDLQCHHQRRGHMLSGPLPASQPQKGKTKPRVQVQMQHHKLHLFSLLLCFLVPCFHKLFFCPRGCMIGWRYYKWSYIKNGHSLGVQF
jgi:hypothetical protein